MAHTVRINPVLVGFLLSLMCICHAQNGGLNSGGGNANDAIDLGGGGGAISLGDGSGPINLGGEGGAINLGGDVGPINLGGGGGDAPINLPGGGSAQGARAGPVSLPGVDVGVAGPTGSVNLGVGNGPLTIGGGSPAVGSEEEAGRDEGARTGLPTGGPTNGPGFGGISVNGPGETLGADGALNLGRGGSGSGGPSLNLGGGVVSSPDAAAGPSGATGGISVDEGSGTVIPNTGPETTNNGNNPSNNNNNNNNINGNNARPGPNFGAGAGGFGNINFPDFTSGFGNIGNNFPRDNGNVVGASGLGGNSNGNNNDVFGNFPGFGSTIGTGGRLPNPNVLPNNNNNDNINNVPGGQRFPSLDLNNNFNFGNAGAGAGIRFPGDFNSNTFPGLDNIRFPPFSNANAGGFGEECRIPADEQLPYKVDNLSVPQQVLQQIQQEFGLRPELQLIAQWFSATQGQPAALPQDSAGQVSCPADYHVMTRFVSAQNAECFVLPPPTQDPVVYAKCRCQRCREAPSGRPNRANQCKPVLTPAVLTVFCPLSSPIRIFPMRVQIPTSCRCMLAQQQVRRGL